MGRFSEKNWEKIKRERGEELGVETDTDKSKKSKKQGQVFAYLHPQSVGFVLCVLAATVSITAPCSSVQRNAVLGSAVLQERFTVWPELVPFL